MFHALTAAKDSLLHTLNQMHLTLPTGQEVAVPLAREGWQPLPGLDGVEILSVPRCPRAGRAGPLLNVVYLPAGLSVQGLRTEDAFLLACLEGHYYLNGLEVRAGQTVYLPPGTPQEFHTPDGPAYGVAHFNPADAGSAIPL